VRAPSEQRDGSSNLLRADTQFVTDLPQTTEAERLVVQRIGQDIFRTALMDYWGARCPITGITDPALLRASHIVPWAECDDAQRLDVHTGLLLSAIWDAAFDTGLVSFANGGTVLASPELSPAARTVLGLERAPRQPTCGTPTAPTYTLTTSFWGLDHIPGKQIAYELWGCERKKYTATKKLERMQIVPTLFFGAIL
jgi:hypothetical protein